MESLKTERSELKDQIQQDTDTTSTKLVKMMKEKEDMGAHYEREIQKLTKEKDILRQGLEDTNVSSVIDLQKLRESNKNFQTQIKEHTEI